MKALLNYANGTYQKAQLKNSATGLAVGGFDRVLSYGPEDIPREFYLRNRPILRQRRGNGCWLWKFYFITRRNFVTRPEAFQSWI